MKAVLIAAIVCLGFSGVSMAQPGNDSNFKRFEIDYADQIFNGQHELKLKQALKEQYPRLNLERAELEGVRLVAKSMRGQGTATLVVGGRDVDQKTVAGNPRDFDIDLPRTFDRIDFDLPRRDRGGWQIHTRGMIKVRKVVISLNMGGDRPSPGDRKACFYRDISFEGPSFCLTVGQTIPNLVPSGWNDEISSIKVDSGVSVQFCEHINFGGVCQNIDRDLRDIRVLGRGWNDLISSVRVQRDR